MRERGGEVEQEREREEERERERERRERETNGLDASCRAQVNLHKIPQRQYLYFCTIKARKLSTVRSAMMIEYIRHALHVLKTTISVGIHAVSWPAIKKKINLCIQI
jgi:hypothetical protein